MTAKEAYEKSMEARKAMGSKIAPYVKPEVEKAMAAIELAANGGDTFCNHAISINLLNELNPWEIIALKTAVSNILRSNGFYTFKGAANAPLTILIKWGEEYQK